MDKLDVKAAAISGAVASGVLHALSGILFLGAPQMYTGMWQMMMYNTVQYGMGSFGATNWLGSIVTGAIIGAVIGYLVAVSYNWATKK